MDDFDAPRPETPETRSVPFELRASSDGSTLAGYAAVFDTPSMIHERGQSFNEQIKRGAFAKAINAKDRVVMQFDHGQHPLFGSLPLGKITMLREDAHGLYVEARLTDNWLTSPIRDAIANGALTGMSFRFSVPEGGDTWDRSGSVPTRTITEVRLYELGPVVHPAYEATSVGVRSALNLLSDAERAQIAADLSPTPDEGQVSNPDEANATPDEGQQRRTRNQRQALLRLRLTA